MASGSFGVSTSNSNISGTCSWSSVTDNTNNKSTVTATLRLSRTNSGYTTYGTGTFYLTINGNKKTDTRYVEITYNSNTLIITHTVVVTHNSNGEKQVSISWSGGISGVFSINASSGTATLDTIPRESSLTSSANWTAGSNKTLSISRYSSSFRHEAEISVKRTDGIWDWIKRVDFSTSETSKSTSFTLSENTEIFQHLAQRSSAETRIVLQTFDGSTLIGDKTYYGTVTAPTASTSTIDNPTGISEVSTQKQSTVWIDQNIDISITRSNSTFKHTIKFKDGNSGAVVHEVSNISTSYTWSPSASEKNQLYTKAANTIEIDGQIDIYTYYNGILVRSYTANDINYRVRNSDPIYTASDVHYEDIDPTVTALTGDNQQIVQNKSNFRFFLDANATPQNGASIASYEVDILGDVRTSTPASIPGYFTYGLLDSDIDIEAKVKAIDSRGIETEFTLPIKMVPYKDPAFSNSSERVNGFESDTTLSINGTFSPLTIDSVDKNNISLIQYRFKESSSGTWGAWTNFDTTNISSQSFDVTTIAILDNSKIFDVEIQVVDGLSNTTLSFVISEGQPLISFDTLYRAVGINKFPSGVPGDSSRRPLEVRGGALFEQGYLELTAYDETYGDGMMQMFYDGLQKRLKIFSKDIDYVSGELYLEMLPGSKIKTTTLEVDTITNENRIQPSLQNGWVAYGTTYSTPGYWKDKNGVVHIAGLIKNGTTTSGTILFVLPVGYRPANTEIFDGVTSLSSSTTTANNPARIDVNANGEVVLRFNSSATYTSLAGISFKAEN